jgi:Family of unknown function (DUF5808)
MALTFGGIAIYPSAMEFAPILLLISALALMGAWKKPRPPLDPTPDECWKGGMIYYNPDDAALFVQRRDGMGLTFNMANRWSWLIQGSLIMILASMGALGPQGCVNLEFSPTDQRYSTCLSIFSQFESLRRAHSSSVEYFWP